MSDEVKLCELCRMHRKINIGPAGAWCRCGFAQRAGGISGREKKKRRKTCCR